MKKVEIIPRNEVGQGRALISTGPSFFSISHNRKKTEPQAQG